MNKSASKTLFIKELKEGDIVYGQSFGIKSYKKAISKNNKPYIDIELADKTGSIKAKIWTDNMEKCADCKEGDVVYVSGNIDNFNGRLQFIISALLPCDTFELSDFLEVSKNNRDDMFSEIQLFIKNFQDENLKKLLDSIFKDADVVKAFKNSAAAWTVHHSYAGGLMEHILDCLYLAEALIKRYPKLRKDLLLTGVILHDIGKIYEFNVGATITFSDRGKLLGHMHMACEHIIKNAPKDLPQDILDEVLHMILSHHGTPEFGSSVRPKTTEAIALWQIDDTSAKLNVAYNFIYDNILNEDQSFTGFQRHLSTEMYLTPYIIKEAGYD